MDLRTYRAGTLQEALRLVREELGPNASLLHTRKVTSGLAGWLGGQSLYEVTASAEVHVPSRLESTRRTQIPPADAQDFRRKFRDDLRRGSSQGSTPLDDVARPGASLFGSQLEGVLSRICADLRNRHVPGELVKQYGERLRRRGLAHELCDETSLRRELASILAEDLSVGGSLIVTRGHNHVVALVGPTGVGKTTTIAKLAAHFRLQKQCTVGLITVDTFRVAAAEQLRTYADIMGLTLEVAGTPREVRESLTRLRNHDLVLLDTAGRSPRDLVRLHELRSHLAEATPRETCLILSGAAAADSSLAAMESFGQVGATSLILTKMDEVESPGSLLPLLRNRRMPVRYISHGQNVPDDIRPASSHRLTQLILSSELPGHRPTSGEHGGEWR